MRQIYETIDRQGYQWVVVLVAGLGFFLDGYTVRAREQFSEKSGLTTPPALRQQHGPPYDLLRLLAT